MSLHGLSTDVQGFIGGFRMRILAKSLLEHNRKGQSPHDKAMRLNYFKNLLNFTPAQKLTHLVNDNSFF